MLRDITDMHNLFKSNFIILSHLVSHIMQLKLIIPFKICVYFRNFDIGYTYVRWRIYKTKLKISISMNTMHKFNTCVIVSENYCCHQHFIAAFFMLTHLVSFLVHPHTSNTHIHLHITHIENIFHICILYNNMYNIRILY